MALLSSDASPTCSISMSRDGRRTEMCGIVAASSKPAAPATSKPAAPAPAEPGSYPVQLSWSDNSDNESSFVIERCERLSAERDAGKTGSRCTGSWDQITTVPANTTRYTDNTAKVNRTYLYRIKAVNSAGSSGYTQEALITTPAR